MANDKVDYKSLPDIGEEKVDYSALPDIGDEKKNSTSQQNQATGVLKSESQESGSGPQSTSNNYDLSKLYEPPKDKSMQNTPEQARIETEAKLKEAFKPKPIQKVDKQLSQINNDVVNVSRELNATREAITQNQKTLQELYNQAQDPNISPEQHNLIKTEFDRIKSETENAVGVEKQVFEKAVNLQKAKASLNKVYEVQENLDKDLNDDALKVTANMLTHVYNAFPSTISGVGSMIRSAGDVGYDSNPAVKLLFDAVGDGIKDVGDNLKGDTDARYDDKHYVTSTIGDIVGSVVVAAVPGTMAAKAGKVAQTVSGATAATMQMADGIHEKAKAVGLSDKDAGIMTLAIAPISGLMEVWGATNIIDNMAGKSAMRELIDYTVKQLANKQITKELVYETVGTGFKEIAKKYGLSGARSAAEEGITEGIQAELEIAGENIYDVVKGEEKYGTKFFSTEAQLDAAKQAALGAVAGTAFGVLSGVGTKESLYQKATELAGNPEKMAQFQDIMNSEIEAGNVTAEQGQKVMNTINSIIEMDRTIPPVVESKESRIQAVGLISERNNLSQENAKLQNDIATYDPTMTGPQEAKIAENQKRIGAINSELRTIATQSEKVAMERRKFEQQDINQTQQQDAVQEPTATQEVPRPTETGENIEADSGGVRPSQQGDEVTQTSEEEIVQEPVVEQQQETLVDETTQQPVEQVEEEPVAEEDIEEEPLGKTPIMSDEQRVKALSNELAQAENLPKELREKIEAKGLKAAVFSHDEAKMVVDNAIQRLGEGNEEMGINQLISLAKAGKLVGSVKTFAYGKAIDFYSQKIKEATSEADKQIYTDLGAEAAELMEEDAKNYGRYISAIGEYYKNHPDIIARRLKNKLEKAAQERLEDKGDADTIEKVRKEFEKLNEGVEERIQKGIEEALDKIKSKLPTNRRKKADKAIKALDNIQAKLRQKSYSDATGIVAAIDTSLTIMKKAIDKGVDVLDALEICVNSINAKMKGQKWNEAEFRKDVLDGFKQEGVDTKPSKVRKAKTKGKVAETKEKAKKSTNKDLIEYARILSERMPTEEKAKKDKLSKLKELAEKLDKYSDSTEFGDLANDYIDLKNSEAIDAQNNKDVQALSGLLSEPLPKDKKGGGTKIEKMVELALKIDKTTGTTENSELVLQYIELLESDKVDAQNNKDIKAFGDLLSEKLPSDSKSKVTKIEKLKALATKLDTQFGTTEYSDRVAEYEAIKKAEQQLKDDIKAAKEKQQKVDSKVNRFGQLLSKSVPQQGLTPAQAQAKKNAELAQLARELDAEFGTTDYSDAVQEYQDMTDAEKLADEITAFAKLFSSPQKNNNQNKKTKIDRLRDAAKALDTKLGVNDYSKLVDDYANMKQQDAIEREQMAILNKYFPKKVLQNDKKRKQIHQKIIEQYNAGVFDGKVNKDGVPFESLFFEKLGIVNPNSPEVKAKLKEFADKMAKAKEGSNLWRMVNEDMLNYLANAAYESAIKSGFNKLEAMWYANILSSPATHLRNLQFNFVQSLIAQPVLMIEKALLKGDVKAAASIYKNLFRGLAMGKTEAKQILKTGKTSRFDAIVANPITVRGGKGMRVFDYPRRILSATDILFTEGGYQMKLSEMARKIVKKEHPDWDERRVQVAMNQLIGNTKERYKKAKEQSEKEMEEFFGPDWRDVKNIESIKKIREFEIMEESMPEKLKAETEAAKKWTKTGLMTSKPTGLFGRIADIVQYMNNAVGVTKFVMPFVNVPLNIAKSTLERSPLGAIKAITGKEWFEKEKLSDDERLELLLKSINYTIAMAALYAANGDDDNDALVITGNQTGKYVNNNGIERGGGLAPYTLYMFGKPVLSYRTTPWASVFLPAGYMRDYKLYGKNESNSAAWAATAANYLTYVTETSAMQGVAGIFETMDKIKEKHVEENLLTSLSRFLNSLIPYSGAIKFATNNVNAIMGDADKRPIDMSEYALRDMPFVTSGMQDRTDVFGQPVKEKLNIPLVPYQIKEITPEYKMMKDKGYFANYSDDRKMLVKGEEVLMTRKELDQINKRRGELVYESLHGPNVFVVESNKMAKEAKMTTMEYLETLDKPEFKRRMDELFLQGLQQARLEKFGKELGISAEDVKKHREVLESAKRGKDPVVNKEKRNEKEIKKFPKAGVSPIYIKEY